MAPRVKYSGLLKMVHKELMLCDGLVRPVCCEVLVLLDFEVAGDLGLLNTTNNHTGTVSNKENPTV